MWSELGIERFFVVHIQGDPNDLTKAGAAALVDKLWDEMVVGFNGPAGRVNRINSPLPDAGRVRLRPRPGQRWPIHSLMNLCLARCGLTSTSCLHHKAIRLPIAASNVPYYWSRRFLIA